MVFRGAHNGTESKRKMCQLEREERWAEEQQSWTSGVNWVSELGRLRVEFLLFAPEKHARGDEPYCLSQYYHSESVHIKPDMAGEDGDERERSHEAAINSQCSGENAGTEYGDG